MSFLTKKEASLKRLQQRFRNTDENPENIYTEVREGRRPDTLGWLRTPKSLQRSEPQGSASQSAAPEHEAANPPTTESDLLPDPPLSTQGTSGSAAEQPLQTMPDDRMDSQNALNGEGSSGVSLCAVNTLDTANILSV
jgi:hypothetical protein